MCKYINDIPVIKTFFYNNKYYLYDTYTNRLLEVSKNQFMEIKKLKRVGINAYLQLDKPTQSYRDIEMLINKGMRMAHLVFVKSAWKTRTFYWEMYLMDLI